MRLLFILALIVIFVPRDAINREDLMQRVSSAYDWTASICDRDPKFCEQAMTALDSALVKGAEALSTMEDAVRRNLAASNLGRLPPDGQSLDSYAITSLDQGTLTSADLAPPWRGRPNVAN
jgi:hypothetical protein